MTKYYTYVGIEAILKYFNNILYIHSVVVLFCKWFAIHISM